MDQPTSEVYKPGSCNIGPVEIRRRYRIGFIGLGAAIVMALMIIILDLPAYTRWFLFAPVFYGVSGFIQAQHKFCYIYGFQGVFSLTGKKKFSRSKEEKDIIKDRQTARKLLLLITIISAILTILLYRLAF
jgi:hypothetical protein